MTTQPNHLSRRTFLKDAAAVLALSAAQPLAAQGGDFDLIVKGGAVIDAYNDLNKVTDIGIKSGKIAQVADNLKPGAATRVLDAKGLYVSPGWIDLHTHVFAAGDSAEAVHPDRDSGVYTGVTTIADPGRLPVR